MKKLLACLMGALMLVSVAVTPVSSTIVISEKPVVVLIDDFYTLSLTDLMKATRDLKKGDTLKMYSQGPGGNAFVCLSMMNYIHSLQKKGVHVVTESMGLAASANFFMWLIGDERIVNEGDLLMSHLVIPRSAYGQKVSRESLTDEQRLIIDHLNHWIRQRLLNIVGDAQVVNEMLDDDNNWYTAKQLYEMGIATQYNESK
jgi:ATP-dependent protease ClpP protease subunit